MVPHDAIAGAELAPQLLVLAVGVVGDDGVGGIEDRLRAAVVLVEHDRGDVVERFFELGDVAQIGATEAVHALVVVADDGDLLVLGRQRQGDLVLRHVGVLVLVDEHVLKPLLVVGQHVGVGSEQLDRLHQQVVEVHRPGLQQPGLVVGVDVGVLAFEDVAGPLDRLLRGDQLVLPQADLAVGGARREPLGVEVEIAHDVARQPLGIGLVVDAERSRVAETIAVGPQDADTGRVERAHPHRPGDRPDQVGDAVTHLFGGLVGERDRQDRRRWNAFVDEMGDAVGEHPGLARAGTGHHQQRATTVHDRIELIGIEQVEIERAPMVCGVLVRQSHGEPILRKGCHVEGTAGRGTIASGTTRGTARARKEIRWGDHVMVVPDPTYSR